VRVAFAAAAAAALFAMLASVCASDDAHAATAMDITAVSGDTSEYGQQVTFIVSRGGDHLTDNLVIYLDGDIIRQASFGASDVFSFDLDWTRLAVGQHALRAVYGAGVTEEATLYHVVQKRSITVTAEDKSKYFDDPDPALTVKISKPTVGGDVLIGMVGYEGGEVGDHKIAETIAYYVSPRSSEGSYEITFVPGTMRILPTSNISDAIAKLERMPEKAVTTDDADRIAEAYRLYASLSEEGKSQIPSALMAKMESAILAARSLNHSTGLSFITNVEGKPGVPWYVRLSFPPVSDQERARFEGEMSRMDSLSMYHIALVDTATGSEYIPLSDSIEIAMPVGDLARGGAYLVREIDGEAAVILVYVEDGLARFRLDSSGLYAVVVNADVRELEDASGASIAIVLIIGGIAASVTLDRKLKSGSDGGSKGGSKKSPPRSL
jgi:hypothetical protein